MQLIRIPSIYFILGLVLPNMAHAESVHPAVILLSSSLIFLMFMAVYVIYRVRRSLRKEHDKSED
jgi:ABC-type nickel/cobalt efflux system permease component RcnA